MGIFYSYFESPINTELDTKTETNSTKIILINQANCYQCHSLVVNEGVCKCGNVTVFGGNIELGRKVKDYNKYSDASLLEYLPN
jgi:hypothetical protein